MVCDYYYPHVGGVAEHIRYLSGELRRRGHDVRVLTARTPADGGACWLPDEDKVFRIGRGVLVPTNGSYARVVAAWRPVAQVRDYFRREQFDVIHIHGSLAPTLPLAALHASTALAASRTDGTGPVNVMTFHAGHNRNGGYALFRRLLRRYFAHIHGPIAVSEAARWSTSLYFPGSYTIIPNGIDVGLFHPDVAPVPGLTGGRPTVLFMGRFDPRKGLSHLLRALPLVKRTVPDVHCIVAGAGPQSLDYYRSQLDPDLRGSVTFVGTVFGDSRAAYYAASDVFCAPSTGNESFGIILLEAMATAKPVVASDIHGYREVLADGVEGLLAPAGDSAAIADRIVRLLTDRALARQMGEAGRRKTLVYAWPRVADRIEELYASLLA
jgi:phosphatidylinositol alpha-mannosyltransferase